MKNSINMCGDGLWAVKKRGLRFGVLPSKRRYAVPLWTIWLSLVQVAWSGHYLLKRNHYGELENH